MRNETENKPVTRGELNESISSLRTELKSDMSALRSELKSDMSILRMELKTDMNSLKMELKDMFADGIRQLVEFIGNQRAETDNKIDALRTELKVVRSDAAKFKDEIIEEISEIRVDIAVATSYKGVLQNHETRITKLEKEKAN